jgi:hypothetical protein
VSCRDRAKNSHDGRTTGQPLPSYVTNPPSTPAPFLFLWNWIDSKRSWTMNCAFIDLVFTEGPPSLTSPLLPQSTPCEVLCVSSLITFYRTRWDICSLEASWCSHVDLVCTYSASFHPKSAGLFPYYALHWWFLISLSCLFRLLTSPVNFHRFSSQYRNAT